MTSTPTAGLVEGEAGAFTRKKLTATGQSWWLWLSKTFYYFSQLTLVSNDLAVTSTFVAGGLSDLAVYLAQERNPLLHIDPCMPQ